MFDMSVHHAGAIHNVVYTDGRRPVCIDMNSGSISVSPRHRGRRSARRRQAEDDADLYGSDSDVVFVEERNGGIVVADAHDVLGEDTATAQIKSFVGSDGSEGHKNASDHHEGVQMHSSKPSVTNPYPDGLDEDRGRIAPMQGHDPLSATVSRNLAAKPSFDSLAEDYGNISHSDLQGNVP